MLASFIRIWFLDFIGPLSPLCNLLKDLNSIKIDAVLSLFQSIMLVILLEECVFQGISGRTCILL